MPAKENAKPVVEAHQRDIARHYQPHFPWVQLLLWRTIGCCKGFQPAGIKKMLYDIVYGELYKFLGKPPVLTLRAKGCFLPIFAIR